jgi:hypothetical protein
MKELLREVTREVPVDLAEVDIDRDPNLRERFDHEVPVLFIEDRKAFKYRTTQLELRRRLDHARVRKERMGEQPSP